MDCVRERKIKKNERTERGIRRGKKKVHMEGRRR